MNIVTTNIIVNDYCESLISGKHRVNHQYQRSDKVWPKAARSFLIETIIQGYPVPKLSLYQKTDVKSRESHKEIVDGQQRSKAILDFYNDKLKISRNSDIEEIAGKSFSELEEEDQSKFLNYSLSVDLFVSATEDEIREAFRRINSYTVPLNPEEQRHAVNQGAFKWFIYRLVKRFDQNLNDMGVFTEKKFVRMADAKLFSEITYSFLEDIETIRKTNLDRIYKDFNKEFPYESEIKERIADSFNFIIGLHEIHRTPLMKPFVFYSFILAVSHIHNPVDQFQKHFEVNKDYQYSRDSVLANLSALADALESDDYKGELELFVKACESATNVKDQRITRFKWLCKALQPNYL
jgi:Protein of unknown function DUF262